MTAKMEYEGRDVDEAIRNACNSLSVEMEQLDIEIKSPGSAGIFGLCRKNAVVVVSLKREKPEIKPRKEKPAPVARKEKKESTAPAPKKAAPRESAAPELAPEILAGLKDDIAQLLVLMGCPSNVTISQDARGKVQARIEGDHDETIIGPEGKTLDSLQYLLRKMVGKKYPEKIMLTLDAGEFRAERKKELAEKALSMADSVKESGRTMSFPPLNPAERRIVHMTLQEDTGIRSRSVGDGLFKKVLIYLPGRGRKGKRRG